LLHKGEISVVTVFIVESERGMKLKAVFWDNAGMNREVVLLVFVCFLFFSAVPSLGLVESGVDVANVGEFGQRVVSGLGDGGVDWWPMLHHDPRRTGTSTSKAPKTNDVRWSYITGPVEYSSPAVVDGVVYIGSMGGDLYALNVSISTCKWSYQTGSVCSSPAVVDGVVFVGSGRKVFALNASSGSNIWSYETGGSVHSSPAVVNGKVYVGSYDRKIYCLDAETGADVWNYTTGWLVFSSPTVVNGKVYVGSEDDKVYCLNASTGAHIWNYNTRSHVDSSPAVVDGVVFVGSAGRSWGHGNATVYALNASSGALIWSYDTSGAVISSPAVVDGKVYVGSWDCNVYALNASSGSHIWSYRTHGIVESSPAVVDGVVFVGSADKKVYALNASSGTLIWSCDTSGAVLSSPAVADGFVYIGSNDGKIYCFGPMIYFNIGVDPIFYDNRGEPLVTLPSSWTILFPNGTEKTASGPETFHGPLGTYSIENVIWKGREVAIREPVSIFLDSNLEWNPRIDLILPTSLSISPSSSTSYVGLKVEINGNLTCNEIGVAQAPVLLSYSVTGGESWNDITLPTTASDGTYSIVWMPPAIGNYLVRATWAGNSTYPEATTTVNFALILEQQNVFSVASNSTVSELAFNSTSRELSFTVSGPSDTAGYANVYVAKSLVANIVDVKVYLDGDQLSYKATSLDDSWSLHFTYPHGTHKVAISLGKISTPFIETPLGKAIIYGAVPITAIVILIVLYVWRKKQRSQHLQKRKQDKKN